MSRERKFRGKTHYGKWIYGGTYDSFIVEDFKDTDNSSTLFKVESITSTMDRTIRVLEDTIGQYTGLEESRNLIGEYDKKEIYEGDIIKKDGWEDLFIVEFEEGKYIARKIREYNGDIFTRYDEDLDCFLYPVVVGNVYENPELLEAK